MRYWFKICAGSPEGTRKTMKERTREWWIATVKVGTVMMWCKQDKVKLKESKLGNLTERTKEVSPHDVAKTLWLLAKHATAGYGYTRCFKLKHWNHNMWQVCEIVSSKDNKFNRTKHALLFGYYVHTRTHNQVLDSNWNDYQCACRREQKWL